MRTRKKDMIRIDELPKPMTKDEKKQLIDNWNDDSCNVLAERNIRLALFISKSFKNTGIDEEELFGVAQLGLVKATRKFRPEYGYEFATFATPVIRNEILMRLRKERHFCNMVSLDDLVTNEKDGSSTKNEELIACTKDCYDEIWERQFLEYIRDLLEREDKKYQEIILLSLDGMKQKEIGERLGISQSYVSRILKKYKSTFMKYVYGY